MLFRVEVVWVPGHSWERGGGYAWGFRHDVSLYRAVAWRSCFDVLEFRSYSQGF